MHYDEIGAILGFIGAILMAPELIGEKNLAKWKGNTCGAVTGLAMIIGIIAAVIFIPSIIYIGIVGLDPRLINHCISDAYCVSLTPAEELHNAQLHPWLPVVGQFGACSFTIILICIYVSSKFEDLLENSDVRRQSLKLGAFCAAGAVLMVFLEHRAK